MNCDNCRNQYKRRICKVCNNGSWFEEKKASHSDRTVSTEKSIARILEEVCNQMCDKYCKYPGMYSNEEWEDVFEDICDKCPLMRLV